MAADDERVVVVDHHAAAHGDRRAGDPECAGAPAAIVACVRPAAPATAMPRARQPT